MPRPSLSEGTSLATGVKIIGVAGVYAPAFVERPSSRKLTQSSLPVSPGFMPRPSLSVESNGLQDFECASVAGVYAPAFVERGFPPADTASNPARVAGVYAPAFVERCHSVGGIYEIRKVSPGFMPRPSLSGDYQTLSKFKDRGCRRGLCPGLR